jgi:dipeptidyl-peptidase-4
MFSRAKRRIGAASFLVLMVLDIPAWAGALDMQEASAKMADPATARLTRAVSYSSAALLGKILNPDFTVHWIGRSERFWVQLQTTGGPQYVVVDSATAKKSAALDLPALTAALVREGADPSASPADAVLSPDGQRAVFRRDFNLWLRGSASQTEQQLTSDGVRDFGYGDIDGYLDLGKVQRRRAGRPDPLAGVNWSPSGRYVLALRQDLRTTPERLLVTEYLPPAGEYAVPYLRRVGVAADKMRPGSYLTLIDTRTMQTRAVALDPQMLADLALPYFTSGMIWWDKGETGVFLLTAVRGGRRYQLARIDVATGRVEPGLIVETAHFNVRLNPTDYARPNVQVLSTGREAVWYSERDGWGHLYLYDLASGAVERQLTRGPWVVADLLYVDEAKRTAYFTAVGREKGQNPYYRQLYRVSLDGGSPQRLTPENADHEFNASGLPGLRPRFGSSLSPDGRYFVDVFSTLSQPARVIVRSASGRLVGRLFDSDASALDKMGWQPAEPVKVKAADGTTDLYGALFAPADFDPRRLYPIVEVTYPGPQGKFAPTTFADNFAAATTANAGSLAQLGFVVVAIDGRGTAYRSREFRDAFLGTEDVFGAADHVAAIRNLAATRPFMDLGRVGITGQSFGGYGSLRAMLLHPDFFKVCVSGVGPGDWREFQQEVSVERFFGVPGDDSRVLDYYDLVSNTRLAKNLTGKLLLIYGGVDENVPLKNAFTLFDALIKANADFDTLIMPDSSHGAGGDSYAVRRTLKYFMDNLGGPLPQSTGSTR